MPALYIEGVSASANDNDVGLSLSSVLAPCCSDSAQITVVSAQLGVDMNRDGSVDFDGSDATTQTNPYCFWLNDNHDGWGSEWNSWLSFLPVQEDLSGNNDLTSTTISCTRDLEDYTRLGINLQGVTQQKLTNGDIVVKLESDGPQIRIFRQFGSGLDYLSVSNTAYWQTTTPYNAALPAMGEALPAWLWTNSTTANLLFDGIGAGSNKLKVVLYAKDGTKIGEGQPVWLNLKTAKDMYDTWTVSGSTASGGGAYSTTSPELNQYILFVHGWNLKQTEKDAFANTAYKRLWWQGYKGRFGAFDWPTLTGFTTFDRSEAAAWPSAPALASLLTSLNSQYGNNVYLFAHSLGNVVAGEALKIIGTGNVVNTYAACQAAIAAHAYDPTTVQWTPHIGTFNTPDDLANYPPTPGNNYFNGVTSAGNRDNFFNQNDWALGYWVTDQRNKPDTFRGYSYDGANYWSGSTLLTYPGDRYTIFPNCVQNPSLALGATASVGPFTPVDMVGSLWPPDPYSSGDYSEHPWHSAEFLFSTVEQWDWWAQLMDSFHL